MTEPESHDAGAASSLGTVTTSPRRFLALAVGPPLVWAVMRSWLEWQEGKYPKPDVFSMSALPVSQSPFSLLLPSLIAVLGIVVIGGLLAVWWRHGGARPVRRVLAGGWVLLWLAGAVALVGARANRAGLGPLATGATSATAQVLGTRPRLPNLRQPGGSELILEVAGLQRPQQVQISDLAAAQLRTGDAITLRWALGRYYGRYLLAWSPTNGADGGTSASKGSARVAPVAPSSR